MIHLLWVSLFVLIVGFDLKHRLILNRVTYPAIVVALALSFASPGPTPSGTLSREASLVGAFFS